MVIEVFRANLALDSRMGGTIEAQLAEIEIMKAMGMLTPAESYFYRFHPC